LPNGPGTPKVAGKEGPIPLRHVVVNLPNSITLARLVLTAVFIVAASLRGTSGDVLALITFIIAAISDFVDGYLARKLNLVTSLGKLLDPLADKILVSAAFVYLTPDYCPVWATALIIGREFLVTGLRQIAIEKGQIIAADNLGKWKTTFQLTFCITSLVWIVVEQSPDTFLHKLSSPDSWLAPISLWGAVGLTALSGFNYLWKSRNLLRD
jgi:CDP-diacylglycerol--glycerol-3-phosphate 3-phosphatidyltransferase